MPRKKTQAKKRRPASQKNSKGGTGAYSLVFFGLGVIVVIGIVVGYLFLSKPHTPNLLTSSQISSLVNTATVSIPEMNTEVLLQNGSGEFVVDGARGAVTVSEPYFSVKTDDGHDLYAVMTVNTGGSGEFVNVALFKNENGDVEYIGAYPMGDRVKVTEINGPIQSQNGEYTLTVDYLDRSPDAPMVEAPTIPKTKTIEIVSSNIVLP